MQEGKVYVKQSLNAQQYTIEDLQKMLENNSYVADRIIGFGEDLRESRQFWYRYQSELSDMIKQLGIQGMVFFTFSAADFH